MKTILNTILKKPIQSFLVILALSIGIGGTITYISVSMREAPVQDTDLVKCIEAKFDNGEFENELPDELPDELDGLSVFCEFPWVSDSIEIIISEDFKLVGDRHEYVDVARVRFGYETVVLTEHESDRIVEIINNYEAKQDSILQIKLDKEQDALRNKITKYCKPKK